MLLFFMKHPYILKNGHVLFFVMPSEWMDDRLCGLVVRVSGYRYRGPGFDPRLYQIF